MRVNTHRWNRIPYTAFAPRSGRIARFAVQRRRSVALLDLRPGERLLIVGAGTGADLPYVPECVEVVAGDATPATVERIRRRARRLGRFVAAEGLDGQALPLPDAQFDAVVLHLVVAVIPDPSACLREVARVPKPRGPARPGRRPSRDPAPQQCRKSRVVVMNLNSPKSLANMSQNALDATWRWLP